MIARLRGTVQRLTGGQIVIDVAGVGYRVSIPPKTAEMLVENAEQEFWIVTYVREDRLELFGFLQKEEHALFEGLIAISGIGPKIALELCSLPASMLSQAADGDTRSLTNIRGIGNKSAEKIAIELKGLRGRHPELFTAAESGQMERTVNSDDDTVQALRQLGYDQQSIHRLLQKIPSSLHSTEERLTAALRSL